MTIKKRFVAMVVALVIVPIISIFFIPFYYYMRSPLHILMRGWKDLVKNEEIAFTEDELKQLLEQLRKIPPDMEVAVIENGSTILLSSMQEFSTTDTISPEKLWEVISSTKENYFYQFVYPFTLSKNSSNNTIIISRALRETRTRRRIHQFPMRWLITFFSIFSITFITAVIHIARSILSSISILDQKTKRIADGDLSTSLIDPNEKSKKNDEIINLTENFEKMRLSILESEERRAKFIMGISHDLRTPVAVIKGYTEAIADDVVTNPDDIKNSLKIIHQRTSQLDDMITSLINYVKLSNSEWQQKLEDANLFSELSEFIKEAEIMGSLYKREIVCDIDISKELRVPMDRQLFQRALENIFTNAVRYSKEGSTISITAKENSEKVLITISDMGIGIADLEHIFDLFYRGTSSRREEGMGIGLAVVKQIVESHGWKIDVKSEVGKGTAFTIMINL